MSRRLALIIANSEFSDPKLEKLVKPSLDAEALTVVLGDPTIGGFEVTSLINESLRIVRREIARLNDRKIKGDLLLLHCSGHGLGIKKLVTCIWQSRRPKTTYPPRQRLQPPM